MFKLLNENYHKIPFMGMFKIQTE